MKLTTTLALISIVGVVGCFPADGREEPPPDSTNTWDTDTDTWDTDTETETTDTETEPDPNDVDDDGDGWTENEGDCDDTKRAVNPGEEDVCDDIDNDCDHIVDEDGDRDSYEPNDSQPYHLGDLTHENNTSVSAYLFTETDKDIFSHELVEFTTEDFWVSWSLTAPPGIALAMDIFVIYTDETEMVHLGTANDAGPGGTEYFEYDGEWFWDDGTYFVDISSVSGESCSAPYKLIIDAVPD